MNTAEFETEIDHLIFDAVEKLASACLATLMSNTDTVSNICVKSDPSVKEINDVARLMRLVIKASTEAMSENAFGDKIHHILSTDGSDLTLSVDLRLVDQMNLKVSVSHTITSKQSPDSIHMKWADAKIKNELFLRGLKGTNLSENAPSLLNLIQASQLDHAIYDYKGVQALAEEVTASRRKILGMVAAGPASKKGVTVDYPGPRVGNVANGITKSWYFKASGGGQTIFEISVTDHPKTDEQMARQETREDVRFLYQNKILIEAGVPFLNPYPTNSHTRIVVAGKVQQILEHLLENVEDYRARVTQRL